MAYNIVLTTAEDIVGVVDAVLAKSVNCDEEFISEFTDLTEERVKNALHMAKEFNLVTINNSTGFYASSSPLSRLIVSARDDDHKAAIMRFVLEQYQPFIDCINRFTFSQSIQIASKQIKALHGMNSNQKDIENTIISISTYAKVINSEGANKYTISHENSTHIDLLKNALNVKSMDDTALRKQLGEDAFFFIDQDKVFNPLSDAYSKTQNISNDSKAPIVYAGNAFESFLEHISTIHDISLSGKYGIISKSTALSSVITKKHRGMIEYIGQVRNAADHGPEMDEEGKLWSINEDTSLAYPFIVATITKGIVEKEKNNSLLL